MSLQKVQIRSQRPIYPTPAGLVNGETLDSLGVVAFGGDSQTAVNHGTYTITDSGLDDSNYTIAYEDGTLTIDKAAIELS